MNQILWAMQFLEKKSRDIWYRHEKISLIALKNWTFFKQFLLDLIEDSMNRNLHYAQSFNDAKQRSHQFVNDFDVYLSSIEEYLFLFTKTQLISNYYTKLRSELRKMLRNYQNISNTRRDMIVLVARFERNNRIANVSTSQNNQERKNSRHNENNNSKQSQKTQEKNKRKNIDKSKKKKKQWNKWFNTITITATTTSNKDIKSLVDVKCWTCHKKEHYASNCSKSKKENVNKISVKFVENSKNDKIASQSRRRNNDRK